MTSKYRNIRTVVDGINFASKAEARRYQELKLLQKAGDVRWFICQPRFDLPGGIKYFADFLVVWDKTGRVGVEDVKGMKTGIYKLKKKLFKANYPIPIEEK